MATAHTIVEKFDIDDVLGWYENQKESAFKIFVGFKEDYCRYEYDGNDKEEGLVLLNDYLSDIKKNPENTNKYLLQVYSGAKTKTSSKKGITFQLNRSNVSVGNTGTNDPVMREVLNELRALRAERFEREVEDDIEEEEEQQPQSILAGVMNHPQVQNMIMQIVGNIAASFMQPKTNSSPKLAGIEEDDVDKILQILFSKGVTKDDLIKLASMDQSQITMLLTMLRK